MEKEKIVIATRSAGKFPEIIALLDGLPFEFLNLNDVQSLPKDYEVEEPALTFEGNAIIKAMTIGNKTGLLTLAEDTGLEVDALLGRPGVYTARYAEGTDEDRYMKLLNELDGIPEEERTANFKTVVAIYNPKTDRIRTCESIYKGRISINPIGENGFGYDPIFYNTALNKTNAQMTVQEKNSVSHRGNAMQKAKKILLQDFI